MGQQPAFFIGVVMNAKKIEDKAYSLLEDYLDSLGYEVVLIEFLRDQKGWVLRVFIDGESGVTIDDCVKVNDLISPLLDVEDFIKVPYSLEISSPGVNRPLRKPEHFKKVIGEDIKVSITEPVENNRKNYKGKLLEADNDKIVIEVDNKTVEILIDNIKKSKLIYKF